MNIKTNFDNSTLNVENDTSNHTGSKPRIKNNNNPFCFGTMQISPKFFEPDAFGNRPLISVPRNFLFPLRPPPITPKG